MKVKFDFTLDDLVDAAERGAAHSKLVRAWRWRDMILTAVLGGVITYVLRSGSSDAKLVSAVIGAIIAAAIYSFAATRSRKGRLRKLFRERLGGEGPYPFEIELTPAALVTTQAGTRSEHAWSTIVEVKDSPDAIDFVTRGAGIIVVRNRAFHSDKERREFLELARKFAKTHVDGIVV
jgi:hypothetical protein